MKAKKKPRGIKQKIREEKERERRLGLRIVTAVILAIIISISGFMVNSMLNQPSTNQATSSEPRAAIVDHLSLTAPNPPFIENATNTLKQAGYIVDYYPGEQVTVGFYRNLPTHGYGIIILRVHSTGIYGQLFTSEPYSTTKYVEEQLNDRVLKFSFNGETPFYFGISPLFVKYSMDGNFQNTAIIMMGCDGLKNPDMAQAFIDKGAKVYISWSESVLASHTDQATAHLLRHLILKRQTIKQAVDNTMQEVGSDPEYNSLLVFYPSQVGEQTIENP
jgi:hypothetical protein